MTMTSCLTDGIDDYYSETQSIYSVEDDALCDISICMAKSIDGYVDPVWKKWRHDKLEKCLDAKLIPKWNIEYWYLGMRFQRVVFTLHKKKKHFVRCHIVWADRNKNFKYGVDESDESRMNAYIAGRDNNFYKKKLYCFIDESAAKRLFTPCK